ncbi:MAG: SMC-Scp complex subunit ScpB [Kiritimatiellae bacterium]|nr:SMC-Scp complex subunit ScpB [Kiritimatiellia bacterium]
MWNSETDRDVDLRSIVGALVLGADHPLTPAEIHKIVEDVEIARREQASDAPDVTDAELEAAQAEADIAAGRIQTAIPKAEAEAAVAAARAAREAREKETAAKPPSKICPPSEIRKAAEDLRTRLAKADVGFELAEVNGGWRLMSSASCGPWLRQMFGKGRAAVLSRAAVETLAIVAWRQPVARSEIESVRGVNAGHVIKALMESGLVRIVGRSDLPGRPFLFGTTPAFLEHFGLKSLDDLEKVEGAAGLSRDKAAEAKKPTQQELVLTR